MSPRQQRKSKEGYKNLAHFIGRAVNGGRKNKVFREALREKTVGKSAEGEGEKQSAVTEKRQ